MALKIRTADGKTFYRCGIKFTGDAIVVSNKKLKEPYGSPEPSKSNPTTVQEVLLGERMLVCGPVRDDGAGQKSGDGAGQKPGDGDGKDKNKGAAK